MSLFFHGQLAADPQFISPRHFRYHIWYRILQRVNGIECKSYQIGFFAGRTVCYCSRCREDIWKIYPCILSLLNRYIYILLSTNSKWLRFVNYKLMYIIITLIRTLFMGIAHQMKYISKCIHIYYDIVKCDVIEWIVTSLMTYRRTNPGNFRFLILGFFVFK